MTDPREAPLFREDSVIRRCIDVNKYITPLHQLPQTVACLHLSRSHRIKIYDEILPENVNKLSS